MIIKKITSREIPVFIRVFRLFLWGESGVILIIEKIQGIWLQLVQAVRLHVTYEVSDMVTKMRLQ